MFETSVAMLQERYEHNARRIPRGVLLSQVEEKEEDIWESTKVLVFTVGCRGEGDLDIW